MVSTFDVSIVFWSAAFIALGLLLREVKVFLKQYQFDQQSGAESTRRDERQARIAELIALRQEFAWINDTHQKNFSAQLDILQTIGNSLVLADKSREAGDKQLEEVITAAATSYKTIEESIRELRGVRARVPAGQTVTDTCKHCDESVSQYFIDGYGRTTCEKCKPEGFADAVARGTAKL